MAAKTFGARAVGVEMREDLAKRAMKVIHDNGLSDRVTIVNGDLFKVDLTSADVIFLYLTTSANEKVKPKMEAELKKSARVVSHDYEVVGWTPQEVENFIENPSMGYPSHTIYLYKRLQ
jgi:tRNA A58 N-methylase Trm61